MSKIPTPPKPKKLFLLVRRQLLIHTLTPSSARKSPFISPYFCTRSFLSILLFTLPSFNRSGDEEEIPAFDATARTSTSHTIVVSEVQIEGEESSPPQQNLDAPTPSSSPLVPSPKRTKVETIMEPARQLGSSSSPLLDDVSLLISRYHCLYLLLFASLHHHVFPVPTLFFIYPC
jgi:hypothetical protein